MEFKDRNAHDPTATKPEDRGAQLVVEEIVQDLARKTQNAARRGKPTMWAYYLRMHEHVKNVYCARSREEIVEKARWVEQQARRMCLASRDASPQDKATWYAFSVYARLILRRLREKADRGWVRLWLKEGT